MPLLSGLIAVFGTFAPKINELRESPIKKAQRLKALNEIISGKNAEINAYCRAIQDGLKIQKEIKFKMMERRKYKEMKAQSQKLCCFLFIPDFPGFFRLQR